MQTIKHFINTHKHMWWGLYLPVYLIMFFTIEHFITDNYWATQTVISVSASAHFLGYTRIWA